MQVSYAITQAAEEAAAQKPSKKRGRTEGLASTSQTRFALTEAKARSVRLLRKDLRILHLGCCQCCAMLCCADRDMWCPVSNGRPHRLYS